MAKVQLEFIHTCPCCDSHSGSLKEISGQSPDIDLKIYYAGKDFDYIPKYGPVTKGTLIVNGKKRYEESLLSKKKIQQIVDSALQGEL